MKQFFLLVTSLAIIFSINAQSYEGIKDLVILMQYEKAKEEIDKAMPNAPFNSKPEAYLLKAAAYAGLVEDQQRQGIAGVDKLLTDAESAFSKYKQMDPALSLLSDLIYQNAPINIYNGFYFSGYKDYENKNWLPAFEKFKKVVEYSDLLISKKIIKMAADTNSLLLAGITAENAGLKDDAAKFYGRLADIKVAGADHESIYRYLVRFYFGKKDMINFEKYKALGKQLYPASEFFAFDKVDFATGLETDFNAQIRSLKEITAKDLNNLKAQEMLGELIYDTLYSTKAGTIKPSNADELEKTMEAAFVQAGKLNPGSEWSFIYLGDHYISKSLSINNARKNASSDAQKEMLVDQYDIMLEKARAPLEKAAGIYATRNPLSNVEKKQYKTMAGYLADIYAEKKQRAKANPAEAAKFAAEEKKWDDLYDSIR